MFKRIILSLVFVGINAFAGKFVKIAVIDTGIDEEYSKHIPHCSSPDKDFSGTGIKDAHGHGTHIASIIASKQGREGYCLLIIKFWNPAAAGVINGKNLIDSINYAVDMKVDVINLSVEGDEFQQEEFKAITRALKKGIKIFVAAGNSNRNIDDEPSFPASYPPVGKNKITIVGSKSSIQYFRIPNQSTIQRYNFRTKKYDTIPIGKHAWSNYGARVNQWEDGKQVLGAGLNGKQAFMSGTSQATAIATGKYVRALLDQK